jgi:hypothetical protein
MAAKKKRVHGNPPTTERSLRPRCRVRSFFHVEIGWVGGGESERVGSFTYLIYSNFVLIDLN